MIAAVSSVEGTRAVLLMRLLTFKPGAPGEVTDQYVREVLLPDLGSRPSLCHAYLGRSGTVAGARVALTVWDGEAEGLAGLLPSELATPVLEPTVELAEAAVALTFESVDEPLILRVFRGMAQSAVKTRYLDAVLDGTLADVASGSGPHALFLGSLDEERFITASVWSDWRRIEAATGGNIRQPIATRHAELLREGTAEHYEIVPSGHLPALGARSMGLAPNGAPSS
jgi:hypothetical protein